MAGGHNGGAEARVLRPVLRRCGQSARTLAFHFDLVRLRYFIFGERDE